MNNFRRPELLAPAGNFEKLETAIHFGADAVYLGGKDFSLRNFADNFSLEEMENAVNLARSKNIKTYITINIFPRNYEIKDINNYINVLREIKPDAFIIADPGIMRIAKKHAPEISIHLSTQANTTNKEAALFWLDQNISRINLARELSLDEIKEIKQEVPIEIETFVHGAMCISYSGRCLLSSFMSGRSSNHGECSHPCRWKYQVQEEMRPNEYYPVYEDKRGTYIFNSKDLCMLSNIDEFIKAGVDSLKIEGRMKGIFYLASVLKVYKDAIDSFCATGEFKLKKEWTDLISTVANREYCSGFYFNDPEAVEANLTNKKPENIHNFLGKIVKSEKDGRYLIEVKNKITPEDTVYVLSPDKAIKGYKADIITDQEGKNQEAAQPNQKVILNLDKGYLEGDLIFKKGSLANP